MRNLHTLAVMAFASHLLIACSSGSTDDPIIPNDTGVDPSTSVPLIDPIDTSGSGAAVCSMPPDFQTGDTATYRYTDGTGAQIDISLGVTSTDDSAIVFDITEGASVYQAAVPTSCNDTPQLDIPGSEVSASLQALIDQYVSRPLLGEIVQPYIGRFDDGTDLDPESEVINDCSEGNAAVPPPDGPQLAAYICTYFYDPNVAGSTVTVRTTIAQSRRDIEDYSRLVEKRQTTADGSTSSLVLLSFEPAD